MHTDTHDLNSIWSTLLNVQLSPPNLFGILYACIVSVLAARFDKDTEWLDSFGNNNIGLQCFRLGKQKLVYTMKVVMYWFVQYIRWASYIFNRYFLWTRESNGTTENLHILKNEREGQRIDKKKGERDRVNRKSGWERDGERNMGKREYICRIHAYCSYSAM